MKKSAFSKFVNIATVVVISVFFLVGCVAEDPANNSRNGGGDDNGGSSNSNTTTVVGNTKNNATLVTVGNSSSHIISSSGEHWFKFIGSGDPIIFETTGDVVDTYMTVETENSYLYTATDDNSGDGNNALCKFTTKSGETYWIKITARSSTNGTYTFVVE